MSILDLFRPQHPGPGDDIPPGQGQAEYVAEVLDYMRQESGQAFDPAMLLPDGTPLGAAIAGCYGDYIEEGALAGGLLKEIRGEW